MGGLVAGSEGPALELYDGNDTMRVVISLVGGMPNVTLKDASGTGRLALGIVPTGPGLTLFDERGAPRVQLDVGREGPRLYVDGNAGLKRPPMCRSQLPLSRRIGPLFQERRSRSRSAIWAVFVPAGVRRNDRA
jgi:hypothetical protein